MFSSFALNEKVSTFVITVEGEHDAENAHQIMDLIALMKLDVVRGGERGPSMHHRR